MKIKRALIVKKEWLDKILDGTKTWEMRSTKTSITGRIGLIEAGTGHIVGEVDLIGCGETLLCLPYLVKYHQVTDPEALKKWKYAWILENPLRYKTPKPYTHPKGAVIWVKI